MEGNCTGGSAVQLSDGSPKKWRVYVAIHGGVSIEVSHPLSVEESTEMAQRCVDSIGVLRKEWQLASAKLVSNVPVRPNHLPWIFNSASCVGTERVFGNLITKESFSFQIPDFLPSAHLLYSKDGWLLFHSLIPETSCSLLHLLNPISGTSFCLPRLEVNLRGFAAFSTISGTPDYVVHVIGQGGMVVVRVALLGGTEWEMYMHRRCRRAMVLTVLLCNMQVLIFCRNGQLLIFNLTDKSWHSFPVLRIVGHIAEYRGEVFFAYVNRPYELPIIHKFYKLVTDGISAAAWVHLDDEELENRVWFLGPRQSFVARGDGKFVYRFVRHDIRDGEHGQYKNGVNVHVHDLSADTVQKLVADPLPGRPMQSAWVDMGMQP